MDSVAWYNGTRLHSALGYRKPRLVRMTTTEVQECSLTELSALSVKAGQPHPGA
jgi:hypothetical protein